MRCVKIRRNNGPDRGVSTRLSLAGLAFLFAVALVPWSAVPASAADPSPAPALINLTGHWATPLDAGGLDIVQAGSKVSGSSLSGIHFTGTISGLQVSFTFWRGASYAKATSENRGSGTMSVSANGSSAAVTWHSEDGKGQYNGSFELMKVGPPAEDKGPLDAQMVVGAISEAIAPFLPPAASPSPGASPPAALQQVLNEVMPTLDVPLDLPSWATGGTDLTPAQQAQQNELCDQAARLRLYNYELEMAALDKAEGKPITPERQARLDAFYNQIRSDLDNTANEPRYPDPPAPTTP